MEAATRIFKPADLHFPSSVLLKCHSRNPFSPPTRRRIPPSISTKSRPYCFAQTHSSPLPNWNPLLLFRSLSHPQSQSQSQSQAQKAYDSLVSTDRFARILSGSNCDSFEWKFAPAGVHGADMAAGGEKPPIVSVVLLGWLGSRQKHLRRYEELYHSKGIHALTFVASVRDVLSFDLGRRLDKRISGLASEIARWLSETEKDGRQRFLLFHTFSNTGWLAYGSILNQLQGRQDLLAKVKGCVIDSGGDPEINPKVWAAGFTAALLKKRSSAAHSSFENGDGNEIESGVTAAKMGQKEPLFVEVFLLSAFEKLFSYLLNLPDINERLTKIITTLSKSQTLYPQLYLYSTADKVIPFQSVESFVEDQRKIGSNVTTYNFVSTPHVDHYRTFPDTYQALLENFIECLSMVKQM